MGSEASVNDTDRQEGNAIIEKGGLVTFASVILGSLNIQTRGDIETEMMLLSYYKLYTIFPSIDPNHDVLFWPSNISDCRWRKRSAELQYYDIIHVKL